MDLKSLIDQPGKLPTIPKVGQQLIASFSSDDVSVREIAGQLTADPALSAKLLRLANSAYFHVSRTIGTVEAALQMLGFVMVRNLVLGNSVAGAFKHVPGIDLKQFWRYNLYTACTARWLAQHGEANSDMVFTLGLMHGIGQLQMHMVMPQEVAQLDKQMGVLDAGRAQLEVHTFGFHYGEVSAELARIWNFPLPLIEALRHIPQPLLSPDFSEPAAWVHMGAWRARVEVLGLSEDAQVASYPGQVGERLGLNPGWSNPASASLLPQGEPVVMPPLLQLTEGLEVMFE
ncbi:HDOD domain-containing protein [Rhodoferax sp.]|uniref:HDOD domain-containing protein n=1 Tax=Rhodoferax sp. TaxID=50421 RepID=UPI002636FDFF|nr:HDOD domain-containing protein [Rhodoferax sp.]MDD2924282.1 HDOD domain-containing protein [Rhodoferax sp.]